ncbi:MAG: Hpt domain-containing protein, partial [Phycisphaerales bacterium]|nr:Hpt domain-containing protein [Phycisphaerales bacterium]
MSDYVPDISDELLAGFVDEAPEYLEILDDGLMALEQKAQAGNGLITLDSPEDHSRMNEMFRAAHSFKGLGAAMGFDKIRDLTHVMETLFDQLRMGKLALADDAVEILFKVIDRLKALISELTAPPDAPVEIEDCVDALEAILRGESKTGAAGSATPPTEVMDTVNADTPSQEATAASETAPIAQAPAVEEVPALGPDAAVLDNADLAHLFVDSTIETLDELNATLLKLEETPDDSEAINDVFRCAHNIKGATGAAGCTALYRMTHEMETVLDLVRSHELELSPELMQAIFAAADRVRADVTLIKNNDMTSLTGKGTVGIFSTWLAAPGAGPASGSGVSAAPVEAPADVPVAAAPPPCEPMATSGFDGGDMVVHVRFPKDFIEAEVQAYLIKNKLEEVGEVFSTTPDVDALDGTSTLEEIRYFIHANAQPEAIEAVIRAYTVESVRIQPGHDVDAP